jgi:hypothetical protein
LLSFGIEVRDVPDMNGVMINVSGIANVKISSVPERMFAAIERFLGKTGDIPSVAKENLEGNLRSIIGTMSVEDLIGNRQEFMAKVKAEAGQDLATLGLDLDLLNIQNIADGKGYIEADGIWREYLSGMLALRAAGWCVVMLAHSQVTRFDDPSSESYDRYTLKLHKRAAALVTEVADVIGFMHWETSVRDRENGKGSTTRAVGTGHRNIALQETPSYVAKSRYPMPAVIRMDDQGHNLLTALHTAGASLPLIQES